MTVVGAYEAKTHLPELLARVEGGERFTITRHGRPIAELVPVASTALEDALSALLELRNSLGPVDIDTEELIKAGRRL